MKPHELEAFFKARGIPMLPPDHPIYFEGPSITLSARMQKPSGQKDIVSHPSSTQSDSDSTTPNGDT